MKDSRAFVIPRQREHMSLFTVHVSPCVSLISAVVVCVFLRQLFWFWRRQSLRRDVDGRGAHSDMSANGADTILRQICVRL